MKIHAKSRLAWHCGATMLIAFCVIALGAALPVDANKTIVRNMKALSKSLTELSGLITDSDKTKESLKLILDVQKKLLLVKTQRPGMVSDAPREERDKLQLEFRLMINKALLEVIEAEIEILEGNADAAAERLRGPLAQATKGGHSKFRTNSP